MHALTQDLLEGRPPFHRVPSSLREALRSFGEGIECFLLGTEKTVNGGTHGDVAVLDAPGIEPERIAKVVALYQTAHARRTTLERLTTCGLDAATAEILADVAGNHGPGWFDKDPFVVAGTLGWSAIARLRTSLGIPTDDPRFGAAAVAFVLRMKDENGDGDTVFLYDDLVEELVPLLGGPEQAHTALEQAWADGRLSWSDAHGGGYQSIAMAAMEEAIAEWVQRGVAHLAPTHLPPAANGHPASSSPDAQKAAVETILRQRITIVHGSAGTGKTTLLGKLVQAAAHTKRRVFLLALAAKAARRIEESTGHEASTLERFLLSSAKARLRSSDIVVVDEAGMLCVADLYRLVRAAGGCSIALVGDPIQLPPIQSGRPFLDMLLSRRLPTVHLRQVHRQAAGNPILDFALAVREGDVEKAMGLLASPLLVSPSHHALTEGGGESGAGAGDAGEESSEHPVSASDTSDGLIQGLVHIEAKGAAMLPHLAVFHTNHSPTSHFGSSQILAGVKDGPNGVHAINRLLCERTHAMSPSVGDVGPAEGVESLGTTNAATSVARTLRGCVDLPVGAPVVVMRNLPDHALDNGTLGTVFDTEWVVFPSADGSARAVEATPDVLAALMPAYALTIHKAQGSQWRHVALAVGRSRLLDRSLLYTAATRAMEGLLIVGTKADIAAAIAAPPRVLGLRTSLRHRIERTGTTS